MPKGIGFWIEVAMWVALTVVSGLVLYALTGKKPR